MTYPIETYWLVEADFDRHLSDPDDDQERGGNFIEAGTIGMSMGIASDEKGRQYVELLFNWGGLIAVPLAWANEHLKPAQKPEEW
jgi:hypothetical protein